ncbi:MAG: hypothetical protein D6776_11815 [Planctomycetota bacterium]|nr:MAG: hypothetical protein D6776_11815 [Planctomycetota bacterium]
MPDGARDAVAQPGSGPPWIIAFDAIEPSHQPLVGGKGAQLGELRRAGFPVPDGFCLTTEAMRAFVRQGELYPRLERIIARLVEGGLDARESWAFLGETRRLMARTPLPPALRDALQQAYEGQLGGRTVAVRSSGIREDTEDASFAGQYESFLNVRGFSFLEDAVRRCWASIWRNRVLHYVGRQVVRPDDLAMGVVVQRLVKAECSGVLFTVNPLNGRDDEMVVEATIGLGETLVSGKVNPDRYVLSTRTGAVLRSEIGEKRRVLDPLASFDDEGREVFAGGLEERECDGATGRRRESLDEATLAQLVRTGRAVQRHFQRPMDIEWARAPGGDLQLVQARAITRLGFDPDEGQWTDANFKDGGVASDVCVPFMASLYRRIFSTTMTSWWVELGVIPPGTEIEWLRVRYARPYWNVGEVKRYLLLLPGFVEREFDEDLGIERAYEGPGRCSTLTLRGVARGLRVLWRQRRMLRRRLEAARAVVAPFLERYEQLDAIDLDALGREELFARYRALIEETYVPLESTYFYTAYAVSVAKIDFKRLYDRVRAVTGGRPRYADLVTGLRDVAHLRPYVELHRLVAQARDKGLDHVPGLADLVHRYRHHSTRELDITVPRWGEDPSFLERTAEQMLRAERLETDPAELERRQVEAYERARAALHEAFSRWPLRLRPWLRRRFLRGLEQVRAFAWWREEVRDCSIRCYWLVRKWTLAVGRALVREQVLERCDDVFYLRWEQLDALLRGQLEPAEAREEVAFARAYVDSFRRFTPPHEIGVPQPETSGVPGQTRRLRGVGGSSGVAEGTAKVVRRLEEADKLEPGDILVTVFTDPGWTPLMSLAGALVTETGGLLSHAAVISREYGIPAVLACSRATQAIADGDRLRVDGSAGIVEVVAESLDGG